MKCTVVGKTLNEWINKTTGELMNGCKLYVTTKFRKVTFGNAENFGLRCIDVSCPKEDIEDIEINEVVDIDFDDKGKYLGLERLNPPAKPVETKK